MTVCCLGFAPARQGAADAADASIVSVSVLSDAGYDSNRFAESDGAGSAFASLAPEARLTWFTGDATEINLSGAYWRREYLSAGSFPVESLDARAALLTDLADASVKAVASLGTFTDEGIPSDDHQWVAFAPTAWYTDALGREVSLGARIRSLRYDSRLTAGGDEERALYWSLAPGLSWPVLPALSLWCEASLAGLSSNEQAAEYDEWSGRAGLAWQPIGKWRGGGLLEYGRRRYAAVPGDDLRVEENALSVEAWLEYRYRPWLELVSSARALTIDSNLDGAGYDLWQLRAGVRLTFEPAP